jgi:hypothetical protein
MAVSLSALRAGRPLPPGRFLVLIYAKGWVDPRVTLWLEGLSQLKNAITSSGIGPVTFRPVAHTLPRIYPISDREEVDWAPGPAWNMCRAEKILRYGNLTIISPLPKDR